jgi:hypothetical protein
MRSVRSSDLRSAWLPEAGESAERIALIEEGEARALASMGALGVHAQPGLVVTAFRERR